MFSPVEWLPGHGPKKEDGNKFVVGVHFAVFDFDDLHESLLPKVFAGVEGARIAHVVLSSWSHTGRRKKPPEKYKHADGSLIPALSGTYYQLRALLPLSRMALVSEWPRIWDAVNTQLFAGLADSACKDVARRYFVPSYQEGAGVRPLYVSRPGEAIDVDGLLASLGPPLPEAAPSVVAASTHAFTRFDVLRIARQLKDFPKKRDLGEALTRIAQGEPYAPSGTRHNLTVKLVREILDRHPTADHEAVAEVFAPSLRQMQPTHINREEILKMCVWKEPNAQKVDHTSRIAEAFGGARASAYVPEDILEMAENLSIRPDEITRRWIIQKGTAYYVLCDGKYRCYSESDVGNAVLRDLAPAATVGIDLYQLMERGGARRKKISELMEQYGSVATEVIVDMSAQRARYDSVTQQFIEAPCPIRVTAKYDPDVEQWLKLLAGPAKTSVLFDWIASITDLDVPCAALYLEGMGGTGKSFLAHALARIFTADGAPTPLREAMADFNELMTACPIVLADETVPTDSRGRLLTGEIREFVQARMRPLRRKYKPAATLKGALRLILAANNRGLLSTTEAMSEYDISALSERFLHIVVQPAARDFIGAQDTQQWMAEDRVARHAMWLVENWEVNRKGRFIVTGESQELVASLTTQTGLRASVCQWVCNFLLKPAMFINQDRDRLVAVDGGRLLVSARAIHESWTLYIQDRGTPPTPTLVARALGGLSRPVSIRDGISVRHYREFDLASLANWGEATGYIDEQGISKALQDLERDQSRSRNVKVN